MITTEHLEAAVVPTAAPQAAPETQATPEVPAGAPTGKDAVKAAERAKASSMRDRMKQAAADAAKMLAEPPAPAPAAEALPTEAPAEEVTEAPAAPVYDEIAGRYRDPVTGNFVAAPSTETETPPAAAPSAEAPATEEAPPAEGEEAEGETITVTLPGRRDGEEDLDVDTDDPKVVERINGLKNDAMRRAEFNRRMTGVEQKETAFREFEATLQLSPESIVDTLSAENRRRFATYLLAQDFDQLLPMLQEWSANDVTRERAILNSQRQAFASRAQLESTLAAQRQERLVLSAVDRLIPDHATPADAEDFRAAALTRLSAIAQQGGDVRPETVAQHLERDIRRYGFLPAVDPAPGRTPSLVPTDPPASRAQAAPAPASVAQRAKDTQQRIAAVAKQRQAAAPVVPVGTGAVPATQFPRPASFKDATKLVSQIPADAWKRGA